MAEPVLKKGSNDLAVRDLQEALKALGFDPGPIDGVFGASTESAVKKVSAGARNPGRWNRWPGDVDQHRRS